MLVVRCADREATPGEEAMETGRQMASESLSLLGRGQQIPGEASPSCSPLPGNLERTEQPFSLRRAGTLLHCPVCGSCTSAGLSDSRPLDQPSEKETRVWGREFNSSSSILPCLLPHT